MMRLGKAWHRRRVQRARVRAQRKRACNALRVLEHQYRIAPLLPLGLAALGGILLGRSRTRIRPPRGLVRAGWRWGLLLARGLF